jgi:phosphate transport system substrate-binding protein
VKGVEGFKGALGYLGLSYFEENAERLTAVAIDAEKGGGCVGPSTETVQNGSYKPLGRPLFVYVAASAADRPEVKAFVDYYYANLTLLTEDALFVPLNPEQLAAARAAVQALGV